VISSWQHALFPSKGAGLPAPFSCSWQWTLIGPLLRHSVVVEAFRQHR
jgi:hypothetical protein